MKIESKQNLARRIDRRDTGTKRERQSPRQLRLGDTVQYGGEEWTIYDFLDEHFILRRDNRIHAIHPSQLVE